MTFTFRLERPDGTPAEPPSMTSAVPDMRPGDTVPLGTRTLRVVGIRDDDADQPPVALQRNPAPVEPRRLLPPVASRLSGHVLNMAFGSPPGPVSSPACPSLSQRSEHESFRLR